MGPMQGQSPREDGPASLFGGQHRTRAQDGTSLPTKLTTLVLGTLGHPKYICPGKRAKGKARNISSAPQSSPKKQQWGGGGRQRGEAGHCLPPFGKHLLVEVHHWNMSNKNSNL